MKYPKGFFGVVAVLSLTVIMAAVILILERRTEHPRRPSEQKGAEQVSPGEKDSRGAADGDKSTKRRSSFPARKRMAVIIDDIGYNLAPVRELLEINAPLTFAILPQCSHSTDAAELVYRAGREILLHLPMEPHNYPDENPGPGTLFLRMSEDDIRKQVERDIESVPHCSGVNNHMGSRFMEDGEKLAMVMKILKEKGLFFIDSRTTRYSRGKELAAEMGVRFASREAFIDNDHDQNITMRNLISAGKKGTREKNGTLLMIGHPYPETVKALKKAIPTLRARGFIIVPASKLAGTITPEGH
ncbi:MAG: divergent polysaccharide deacetylase family protein [Deltaproteobacteria bacterium]|nr:divergent polysaccharide deacetylase family protein [Deltaproteobacteria bacterium]